MWMPYLNDERQDWDTLVDQNIKVYTKGTTISWHYEYFDIN